MLDNYVKTWASEELKVLQPKSSSMSLLSNSEQKEEVLTDKLLVERVQNRFTN